MTSPTITHSLRDWEILMWFSACYNHPWDSSVCSAAAHGGQIEVLQYLHKNGCKWDYYTCFQAARGGHLNVLQYLREKGCAWNKSSCAYIASKKYPKMCSWILEN